MWHGMTPEQRKRFAVLVKSTPGSLRHVVEARRGINSDLAIRMEKAAGRMGVALSRTELSSVCGKCEFARACLKADLS